MRTHIFLFPADIVVYIFLITILPPMVFLFLCGVGSTFASLGWFWYWRSTRAALSNRRTVSVAISMYRNCRVILVPFPYIVGPFRTRCAPFNH